jgi:transposase-like protein
VSYRSTTEERTDDDHHPEEHIEERLTCQFFSESHRHQRISTTNNSLLERFNQELKRRTRGGKDLLPSREARFLRLVRTLAVE